MGIRRQGSQLSCAVWVLFIAFSATIPFSTAHSQPAAGAKVEEEPEVKDVVAGSIDIIDLDFDIREVVPGDPKLLQVQRTPGENQLRITLLKPGSTNILIYDRSGKLRKQYKYVITANDLSLKVAQMRNLLDNVEGITVSVVGDKIIIDGELVVPRDLDRIMNVTDAFGGAKGGVYNLVQLSKVSQKVIAKRIEDEIRKLPSAQNVTVRLANDTFFLEGVVDSDSDKRRAEDVAKTYVPEVLSSRSIQDGILREVKKQAIRNLIVVNEAPPPPPPKMLRITFHFVEISKEYLKNTFFKWAPSLSTGAGLTFGQGTTGGVGATSSGSFSGTISNLIPRLQKGTNGGYARVLFSTVAIGKQDTPISIRRQDAVPYIQQVVNGIPVSTSTNVGITIEVRPSIVGNDGVELNDTSFSFGAIAGVGAGGAPRTTNTELKNSITVRSGDSAVLGGLISNNMSIDIDKDPEQAAEGATGSPIFTLLRSRAFRNSKTQFLVFVTPQIIEDAAEGTADIKKKVIGNKTRTKRFYQ
jgi:pilus assembly protein CpaC